MSFKSIMTTAWDDIKKVFSSQAFQTGVRVAEGVVGIAVPALGPAFNLTANAVLQAEANFAAIGKASGTGPQKLAAVMATSGNLIQEVMKNSGAKDTSEQAVQNFISAVVTVLNATPAQTGPNLSLQPPPAVPVAEPVPSTPPPTSPQ